MAAKEFNDQSYITTALDQYRRVMPDFISEDKLQKYVFKHLSSLNQVSDPDGCGSRLIVSELAGNGKSLVGSNLTKTMTKIVTQIHTQNIDYSSTVNRLFELEKKTRENRKSLAFHFDFASQATKCKDDFIFALFVLRGFSHPKTGKLWLCQNDDYYLIELTLSKEKTTTKRKPIFITDILPKITCLSPIQALQQLEKNGKDQFNLIPDMPKVKSGLWMMGFDQKKFQSSQFQRPYFHLAVVSVLRV